MADKKNMKVLHINLSDNDVHTINLETEIVKNYIGGTGMAAKLLWDETKADTAPFSEENPLVFMIGPLTGTVVPSSSRYVAASISPLTGIWGEGYGGGFFPRALSQTPYQGIIIKGKAKEPVVLWIDNKGAKIVNASHLWGKDTFEVEEILKKEAGQKAGVITIGVAGEKQVKFASIVGDGKASRVVARCGLGAVMGWKGLKAVVVKGDGRRGAHVFNKEKLEASVKEYFPRVQFDPKKWQERTSRLWPPNRPMTCVKNFNQVEFPGFQEKFSLLGRNAKPSYCIGCRTGCFLSMYYGDHKLPPGQHMETLGANCYIDDMEALLKAFELCDRLGLDSISTGQTIAFAMECFEKGLLSKKDCDDMELVWGNAQAMLQVVSKIGNREGIGALLGEGVRSLAKQVGGPDPDDSYAIHTKGLEFPRYDPRSNNGLALQYATSSRGASHMEGFIGIVRHSLHIGSPSYAFPYMESKDAQDAAKNILAIKGMPDLVAWSQNFCSVIDSLGVCKFLANPGVWIREADKSFTGFKPEQFLTWLNYATGWDMSFQDFMKAGERIFNLKRVFNVRRGISRKDDTLPIRILAQPRGGNEFDANNLPPLDSMLDEYYRLRGWNDNGIPSKEKLLKLDLSDITI